MANEVKTKNVAIYSKALNDIIMYEGVTEINDKRDNILCITYISQETAKTEIVDHYTQDIVMYTLSRDALTMTDQIIESKRIIKFDCSVTLANKEVYKILDVIEIYRDDRNRTHLVTIKDIDNVNYTIDVVEYILIETSEIVSIKKNNFFQLNLNLVEKETSKEANENETNGKEKNE